MTDDKQVAAMRAKFEAQAKKQLPSVVNFLFSRTENGEYRSSLIRNGWEFFQAATLAERERCAKLCDQVGHDGYGPYDCSAVILAGEALEGGT